MKKSLAQLFVALLIAFMSTLAYMYTSEFYLPFENKIKDLMFKARGEIVGDKEIIIIDNARLRPLLNFESVHRAFVVDKGRGGLIIDLITCIKSLLGNINIFHQTVLGKGFKTCSVGISIG